MGRWAEDGDNKIVHDVMGISISTSSYRKMAMAISYNNWLFQWDYTFYKYYKWGFLSTYNWYNSGHNCRAG
jgi:hypothetical protein